MQKKPDKIRFLDRKTAAARIRLLRKEKGFTQSVLAEKLGVSRSLVAAWEGGSSLPELGHIKYMSRLFGVPADYIIGVSDQRYNVKIPSFIDLDLTKLDNEDTYLICSIYKYLLNSDKYKQED